ncbi:hypothetical protein [Clostridium saccharobutylicum]|uniref:Four helix bundle protein n=1 Tax=Clostridium saccharobutylicum TaxID=169679 RepID=A0A1S8MZ40_CLOSA|nr:hypothetical protein [Clostridium saccharobutylicum]OOM09450.1 hypothetical protein CLOSAC_37310 [Clostridium saccharobutylicum]
MKGVNKNYYIYGFKELVAYKKAIALYSDLQADIQELNLKDNCSIRKKMGKVASSIARAKGSQYYVEQQIYHYKQVLKYTYQVQSELDRCNVKNADGYIETLIEIRKLINTYINKINRGEI